MWVLVCASVQMRYSQQLKDDDGVVLLSPGYTLESHGLDTTPVIMGVRGRWAWWTGPCGDGSGQHPNCGGCRKLCG